jgi:alkaline phosphatase
MKSDRFRYSILSCLLCSLVFFGIFASLADAKGNGAEAKHIILIIGDGMQPENEIAASRYLYDRDDGLSFHAFPCKGFVTTWDVTTYNRHAPRYGALPYESSSILPKVGCEVARGGTCPAAPGKDGFCYICLAPENAKGYAADSASTATAWATGHKTDSGKIAWRHGDSSPGALRTIAELLREKRGFSIGIVSTGAFSDATPAAQMSHNRSRRSYHAIADEVIRTVRPEVVIGGGHPAYSRGEYMSMTLYNDVRGGMIGDYVFVERRDGVNGGKSIGEAAARAAARKKKLFGLFGGAEGNFDSPVPTDDGTAFVKKEGIEDPLLGEATLAALEVLSKNKEGFFLLVEQGDVDRANHANDYRRMIGAMQDLDAAVKVAVDFVNRPGDGISWANTLLIVTSDHGTSVMILNDKIRLGKGRLPRQRTGLCPDRPALCPRYPGGQVDYRSTQHINDPVSLYAMGDETLTKHLRQFEGLWYPCTEVIDNTQLFHAMAAAAGIPQPSFLKVTVDRPATCPAPGGGGN